MSVRHWLGEAIAAHDESLARLPEGDFGDPGFWLQRAQVAAQIASAEQARIGNLIAWKQLRQTASATALGNSGDAISDEIEEVLGLVGAAESVASLVEERPERCPATYPHPLIAGGLRCALDAGHLGDRHVTGTGHWWEDAA